MDQNRTPLFDAIMRIKEKNITPFDVPGHKRGKGLPELVKYAGEEMFHLDVNAMEELDNICNPVGVIKEAEDLTAQLYGGKNAFFLVNGTTAGIQAMMMSVCRPGDEIIVPRNVHKSITAGLVLTGAIPIYIQPQYNSKLGIAMGITPEDVEETIKQNPRAKVLFLINPTYYGFVSDISSILKIAREYEMTVIVDQAHGSHFRFHKELPLCAVEAGADLISMSLHKTGGSLTQSSLLIVGGSIVESDIVKAFLNLTQTTSPSHILLSSIDLARKQLALHGKEMMENILEISRYARKAINEISCYDAFGPELIGESGVFGFDETKLGIYVRDTGLTGYEVRSILYHEYNIQVELADLYNILCIISIGDTKEAVEKLIDALKEINNKYNCSKEENVWDKPLMIPEVIISPRDAFYSLKKIVSLEDSVGEISGESVMAYPPGIPIVTPGERITQEIVDYIKVLKEQECTLQGTADPYVDNIKILGY